MIWKFYFGIPIKCGDWFLYIQLCTVKKINAQTKLGEVGEDRFTYEFFLTSKGTPDYKFRVLFMQYGITGYPVTVILEEGIADEINHSDEGYTYSIQNRKKYEELLKLIFGSKRFGEILTKLMQLNSW